MELNVLVVVSAGSNWGVCQGFFMLHDLIIDEQQTDGRTV